MSHLWRNIPRHHHYCCYYHYHYYYDYHYYYYYYYCYYHYCHYHYHSLSSSLLLLLLLLTRTRRWTRRPTFSATFVRLFEHAQKFTATMACMARSERPLCHTWTTKAIVRPPLCLQLRPGRFCGRTRKAQRSQPLCKGGINNHSSWLVHNGYYHVGRTQKYLVISQFEPNGLWIRSDVASPFVDFDWIIWLISYQPLYSYDDATVALRYDARRLSCDEPCMEKAMKYRSISGGRLNIKKSSYQYKDLHVKDKTVLRPSYL